MKVYLDIIYLPRSRACLSFILLCLALTILDIVVVETYYRPLQAWDRIWVWHRIYLGIAGGTTVLLVYTLRSLVPLGTILYFLFGLEDTMFYALQGYLPPKYWGVFILSFWEPSLNLVSLINLLGLATILLFTFAGPDRTYIKLQRNKSCQKPRTPIL